MTQSTFSLTPGKAAALLVLLGWIAYANSLTKSFQFDDFIWIVNNPVLLNPLTNVASSPQRPLAALTLSWNGLIGGLNPVGYHLVNGMIHIAAALALFGVVRQTLLVPRWNHRWDGSATPIAFAAAALWIVHPLNTHAVTYIIQRCESAMGLCFVLTLYSMVRGSQSPRPALWSLAAVLSAWVGVGFKEVMITIIPVAILYDRIFLANSWSELLRRRGLLHLGLLSILILPLRSHLQNLFAATPVSENSSGFNIPGLDPITYFLIETTVLPHYLRLAIWPVDLCFDYRDWPAVPLQDAILPGLFLTGLFLISVYGCFRRNGAAFLGLSVFFVLGLTSSFLPLRDVANEYRMYVPLMFLCTLAVVGVLTAVQRFAPDSEPAAWMFLAGAVVALTALTIVRNEDYRSVVALWEDVVAKRPANSRAYFNVGFGRARDGDFESAKKNLQRCLEQFPDDNTTLLNLGLITYREGKAKEGLAYLSRAYRNLDYYTDTETPYATFLHFEGDSTSALKVLDFAKTNHPTRPAHRFHRAGILLDLGRTDEAQAEIADALKLAPDWPKKAWQFANTRLRGAFGDARTIRREALFYAAIANAAEKNVDTLTTLADALAWNDRHADALAPLREAIATTNSPVVRQHLEVKLKDYEQNTK